MTATFAKSPRIAALLLSLTLALAVPQLIVAAAPPAPGTMNSFMVWF